RNHDRRSYPDFRRRPGARRGPAAGAFRPGPALLRRAGRADLGSPDRQDRRGLAARLGRPSRTRPGSTTDPAVPALGHAPRARLPPGPATVAAGDPRTDRHAADPGRELGALRVPPGRPGVVAGGLPGRDLHSGPVPTAHAPLLGVR